MESTKKEYIVTVPASGIGAVVTKSLLAIQINVVGFDIQTGRSLLRNISRLFLSAKNVSVFHCTNPVTSLADMIYPDFQLG